jgi:hypothetical protein
MPLGSIIDFFKELYLSSPDPRLGLRWALESVSSQAANSSAPAKSPFISTHISLFIHFLRFPLHKYPLYAFPNGRREWKNLAN